MIDKTMTEQGKRVFITTDREQKRLQTAWQQLGAEDRRAVRLFAEFLGHLAGHTEQQIPPPTTPNLIPRPEKESAVLALKRLKKSYPMIEADLSLLEKASGLLMKKVIGATDEEVINSLEELFSDRYQQWKPNNTDQMHPDY